MLKVFHGLFLENTLICKNLLPVRKDPSFKAVRFAVLCLREAGMK